MTSWLKRIICVVLISVSAIWCFRFGINTQAQDFSVGVAKYISIDAENVQEGMIISSMPKGFSPSTTAYDTQLAGVVISKPAVAFNNEDTTNSYPVLTSGEALVLVSTSNGSIIKGDRITSSRVSGVGMKATKSGYVVGTAVEDYTSSNTSATHLILLSLSIQYYSPTTSVNTKLLESLDLSTLAVSEKPLTALKYLVVMVVMIGSFILGVFSFGRLATHGIDSLGRNPLASRSIQFGIIVNVLISLAVIGAGVLVSIVILRL